MSPWLQTLLPVAAGFVVVLVGILVFKLHAFLSLILAAVVTAVLTPTEAHFWYEAEKRSWNRLGVMDHVAFVTTEQANARGIQIARRAEDLAIVRRGSSPNQPTGLMPRLELGSSD